MEAPSRAGIMGQLEQTPWGQGAGMEVPARLCDLGNVTEPLCALEPSFTEQGRHADFCDTIAMIKMS